MIRREEGMVEREKREEGEERGLRKGEDRDREKRDKRELS